MSARSELFDNLRQAVWSGDANHLIDAALEEHAHELAERAAAEMSGCCSECDAAIGVMRAVIDPVVPVVES